MPAPIYILRALIMVEVLVFILTMVAVLNESHFLPHELAEWLHKESRRPESTPDKVIRYLDLPLLVCVIVSWAGLWRMWRPAFFLYPGYWIASVALTPFHGATVADPFSTMLLDISALTGGMIISLLLFTPLREEFLSRKKS